MTSLGQTLAALKTGWEPSAHGERRLTAVSGFGSNPGQLSMLVHAPEPRRPGAALVVVLHGCTQTAEGYAAPAGWLDLADRFGFVVMAPEQSRGNNPNLCFNWYQTGDVQREGGEAQSIAQMVSHAIRSYDLDPQRIFITGLSAGGAMASAMLATYPELFAGGAIVAGLPYGAASSMGEAFEAMSMTTPRPADALGAAVRGATDHPGPWPKVSVWHGQSDTMVRPAAGEAVAAQWRHVHGATGPAKQARTPSGRDFLIWMSDRDVPVVELHRIANLGHGAPVKANGADGCGYASRYTPEAGLSSSFEIALGWGLAQAEPVGEAKIPCASNDRGGAAPLPKPSPNGKSAIADIINDALRSAGLLR